MLVSGSTVLQPLGAAAQQVAKRLAVVHPAQSAAGMSETQGTPLYRTFFAELRRLGFAGDRNLAIERWSGQANPAGYDALARDVVASRPDLIFVMDSRLGMAVRRATSEIPIVLGGGTFTDVGLVESLARPGGNLTGISVDDFIAIAGKRIELLHEVVPGAATIGYLTPDPLLKEELFFAPARRRGLAPVMSLMNSPITPAEIRRVFAAIGVKGVDLLTVVDTAEIYLYANLFVELVAQYRLTACFPHRSFADAGGLMSYGIDIAELARRLAGYVARVLGGEKPAEIPVHVLDKLELVLNLRTARALAITFPAAVLARADEVIE
jgi:putative ABC transport system substrate-binding protein